MALGDTKVDRLPAIPDLTDLSRGGGQTCWWRRDFLCIGAIFDESADRILIEDLYSNSSTQTFSRHTIL